MRQNDICIFVGPTDRARLESIVADRNSASKQVWRANIVLATADGLGTNAIMRLTGKSKPCVWRWQERYIAAGVDGLLSDKTRPSRKEPLSAEVKLQVLIKTMEPPPNATHWSTRSMGKAVGISRTSMHGGAVPRQTHSRREPGASAAPTGICAGGGQQRPSLPRSHGTTSHHCGHESAHDSSLAPESHPDCRAASGPVTAYRSPTRLPEDPKFDPPERIALTLADLRRTSTIMRQGLVATSGANGA